MEVASTSPISAGAGARVSPAFSPTGISQAERFITRAESHLAPAYQVTKIGRLALGDAPISFGSTVFKSTLKALLGASASKFDDAIGHASLAVDGALRGTLYSGGLLHKAAAARAPWLVSARSAPSGLTGIANKLGKVASTMRFGMLSISGALGVLKAAKAVTEQGGDLSALYKTQAGRAGVLQAAGSAMLLIKHPAAYLAGAAIFTGAVINDLTRSA